MTQTPCYRKVHQTLTLAVSTMTTRSTNSVVFDLDEAGDQLDTLDLSADVVFAPLKCSDTDTPHLVRIFSQCRT